MLAASLGYALAIGASRGAGDGEEEEEEDDDDDDDDDGPAAVTSAPSSHRAASRGDADAAARAAAAAAATAPHRAEGFILTSASRREGDRRRRRPRCRVCVLAVVASDETKVRRRLRFSPASAKTRRGSVSSRSRRVDRVEAAGQSRRRYTTALASRRPFRRRLHVSDEAARAAFGLNDDARSPRRRRNEGSARRLPTARATDGDGDGVRRGGPVPAASASRARSAPRSPARGRRPPRRVSGGAAGAFLGARRQLEARGLDVAAGRAAADARASPSPSPSQPITPPAPPRSPRDAADVDVAYGDEPSDLRASNARRLDALRRAVLELEAQFRWDAQQPTWDQCKDHWRGRVRDLVPCANACPSLSRIFSGARRVRVPPARRASPPLPDACVSFLAVPKTRGKEVSSFTFSTPRSRRATRFPRPDRPFLPPDLLPQTWRRPYP